MARDKRFLKLSDLKPVDPHDPLSVMNEGGIVAQRLKTSGLIPTTNVESVRLAAEAMDLGRYTEAIATVEQFANQFNIDIV